jgi:hypothetical protein
MASGSGGSEREKNLVSLGLGKKLRYRYHAGLRVASKGGFSRRFRAAGKAE